MLMQAAESRRCKSPELELLGFSGQSWNLTRYPCASSPLGLIHQTGGFAAAHRYSETERVRGKLVLRVHDVSSADVAR